MIALALQALTFAKRLPWQAYAALALIAAVMVSYRMGYNARDERADREKAEYIAAYEQAAAQAREAQIAVNRAAQERYDTLAERIDHEAVQTRVVVRDATTDYIDRNRVQDRVCSASGASAPASGDGAGGGQDVPADAIMVSASDVRLAGEWVNFGINCHRWAMGLAGE